MVGRQVFRGEPGIAADRQQNVVEVMRDAGGHGCQRPALLEQFAIALGLEARGHVDLCHRQTLFRPSPKGLAMTRSLGVAACLAASLSTDTVTSATPFTMVDLGTLPGGSLSRARAIDDHGHVVGWSETATGEQHAVLWKRGRIVDLGTLGGTTSEATDINRRAQIIGSSTTATGEVHAFVWDRGAMVDLGTLGGSFTHANAINRRGRIVGWSTLPSGEEHAFLFENGILIDLGASLGAASQAWDINDRGDIVGWRAAGAFNRMAVLWRDGQAIDIGTLPGGNSSWALAINDRGQILGKSDASLGPPRPFVWDDGVMTDLGIRQDPIFPVALNGRGQVIYTASADSGRYRGYLWEDGVTTALESFGSLSFVSAINDKGQVVGSGSYRSSDDYAAYVGGRRTTDLGTLPGGNDSAAIAINAAARLPATVTFTAKSHTLRTACQRALAVLAPTPSTSVARSPAPTGSTPCCGRGSRSGDAGL